MDFWQETLGAPTRIVAPMVDASELPWRLMCRNYGAELCYTPMLHSAIFIRDSKYRQDALMSCKEDSPLIIQFCGNDPEVMLEAARLAQDHCLAIDINLGCPQAIAKRGHYGAFLQDEWPLLQSIVSLLSSNLKVPVTCKIRRFDSVAKTVEYAKMLEAAGCKMLTVHGRTREQKGPLTGLADWSYVKAVRENVQIPVISNGNIQCIQDLNRCLVETGAVGVMIAEGNLYNPALFLGKNPPVWEPAEEYLSFVLRFPCPMSYIRGHLFKLFHSVLAIPTNNDLRIELGSANTLEQFVKITSVVRSLYEPFNNGEKQWEIIENSFNQSLPPWLCQCYVRADPETPKTDENTAKRLFEDDKGNPISRKKMKKLRRINRRPPKLDGVNVERSLIKCEQCSNPIGSKCSFKMCKRCCKSKCFVENHDCPGHRILVKTRREMARFFSTKEVLKDTSC